jgi:hypothetical protein
MLSVTDVQNDFLSIANSTVYVVIENNHCDNDLYYWTLL